MAMTKALLVTMPPPMTMATTTKVLLLVLVLVVPPLPLRKTLLESPLRRGFTRSVGSRRRCRKPLSWRARRLRALKGFNYTQEALVAPLPTRTRTRTRTERSERITAKVRALGGSSGTGR